MAVGCVAGVSLNSFGGERILVVPVDDDNLSDLVTDDEALMIVADDFPLGSGSADRYAMEEFFLEDVAKGSIFEWAGSNSVGVNTRCREEDNKEESC